MIFGDGEVLANSRTVAEAFGKRHKDVLKALRELYEKLPEEARRNFAPFKNSDLTGESTSHFEMTRDGFTLLAMGFSPPWRKPRDGLGWAARKAQKSGREIHVW